MLAPSILSADFSKLGEQIEFLCSMHVPYLHVDVMDGVFVPNISFGIPIIKCIRKYPIALDVHLMITKPERYIEEFARAGADIITVHAEACENLVEVIRKIKSYGIKVGVAIKPKTSLKVVLDVINELDMVLVMSVEPGFGGQSIINETLQKANQLRQIINANAKLKHVLIEMDGGIGLDNIDSVIASGVNIIVAGSAVFKPNMREAVLLLQNRLIAR